MPTRFYLKNQAAPYTPATIRGAWDATGSAVTKALDAAKAPWDAGAITSVSAAETSTNTEYDVLLFRGVSGPLAAGTIGTGVVNVMLGVYESAAAADFNWHLHIYVTQGDSDVVRGTLLADYREAAGTNEWGTAGGTSGLALNASASLSSVGVSAGDRIVVEIGYAARNTGDTSYTGYLYYGVGVATSDCGDLSAGANSSTLPGYIEFSETLTGTAINRVSQGPVETLLTETTINGRVSQGSVEVLILSPGDPQRISQVFAELLAPAVYDTRLSQFVAELAIPTVIETRMSQALAEILDARVRESRVSQTVVELCGRRSIYCGTPPLSPAALCGKADILAWLEWTVPMKEN